MVAAVPLLAIAIGGVTTHLYHRLSAEKTLELRVRSATYTTLNLSNGVQYADEKIQEAALALGSENIGDAIVRMGQAKTATELTLMTAQQATREWELLSIDGFTTAQTNFSDDERAFADRPKIVLGTNPQTVTRDGETKPSTDSGQERGKNGELSN
ncbi:hypothetical protein WIMU106979_11890 [Williamsia muralis]